MNKRILAAALSVMAIFTLASCSNGSVSDEDTTNEPKSSAVSEKTSIPLEGEAGFADYCVKIAESELKKLDFSSVSGTEVKNSAYARAVSYVDSLGNTLYEGYNENGEPVFKSMQMYKDSKEYIYAEYKDGQLSALSIENDSGSMFFTFEKGKNTEYTVTKGMDGYNKEIRHYNQNGLTGVEIYDPDGNKLLDK